MLCLKQLEVFDRTLDRIELVKLTLEGLHMLGQSLNLTIATVRRLLLNRGVCVME